VTPVWFALYRLARQRHGHAAALVSEVAASALGEQPELLQLGPDRESFAQP
jgi:hypothetical protein